MSVEKEIRKILGEATPAAARAKQDLVRSGLGHDKNMAATMAALKDPEEAMKSPAKRELLLKVMQDLLDVVVNDPSMVMKTKTALRKEEVEESAEDIQEKLVGGQKKLDKNKNGKLDAEDFKKLRGESKKDKEDEEEEDEDEKEMEDDEKEEEDEVELSKDQVDKMIAAMKKAKGFKAHIKTLQGAEEGFVSHAQRKAVWASRNDAKEAMKRKAKKEGLGESAWGKDKASNLKAALDRHSEKAVAANKAGDHQAVKVHQSKMNMIKNKMSKLAKEEVQLEQAPVAAAPVKHRIAVTVSEPDHPMVSKRKEQVLKYVVVSHGPDKAGAQKVGEKFYKKKGYKVHGSEHAGLKEEVSESDNKMQYAVKHKLSKKILSTHKDLASAKDKWKGIDKNERHFYQVVSHSKPAMKESVTTDYSKIAGQSQNKTPTQKLATDYKLATKKTQKEEVQVDEANEYDKHAAKYAKDLKRTDLTDTQRKHAEMMHARAKKSSSMLKSGVYPTAVKKHFMVGEEVQIDELDTSTVKSYLDKVRFKQARSAVQANMGTPGMKKKHSAELEKTAKSMETAKKRLAKEEVQIDEASQFKSKEDAIKYAKEKVKTHRDSLDGIEVHAHSGGFNVNHTSNSSGRNSLKKMGAKHITTVYKEEVQIDEAGPFSYGKPPRKGSVADLAAKKRKEQEKGKMPIEPKDQMVGTAKVVKEAFPTVADARKRMKDALKSKFEKKKIPTGTVYTRKYKEEPEDEKKSDK